ncbi:IDI1 [Cordylochernes scorpioides]|uniref:isopentenyl-diphosphate Delta-isomerase n=1 Tax=Cordylochernes scorpioides TaxID=51811 RepID=A0ABY6JZ39_9ARAC|nr:IDI1 [Cordylochernes scorpioides]
MGGAIEKQNIIKNLNSAGYPTSFVCKHFYDPSGIRNTAQYLSTCFIPYSYKSAAIARILNRYGVNSYFSNTLSLATKLKQTIAKSSETIDPLNTHNAIYSISCEQCDAKYVGETGRMVKTRMVEHDRSVTHVTLTYNIVLCSSSHIMDPIQEKLLDEMCIVVDPDDKPLGTRSKRDCHLMENISKGLLHRAFSAFLFNSKGQLLMQQRSQSKITFPGCYTNTCCSHPLDMEGEKEGPLGVKRAVRRRLQQELGIPPEQVPLEKLQYMTRIHYQAPSGEGTWGEHEVDYIVFFQGDVSLEPNPNEVAAIRWLRREELKDFLGEFVLMGLRKLSPISLDYFVYYIQ